MNVQRGNRKMHILLPVFVASILVFTHAIDEERNLSERIAFACAHRPTLSFCASRNTAEPPFSAPAPGASAAHRSPRTTEDFPKRSDSPSPRRQRWIFIPAKALEKELPLENGLRETPVSTRHSSRSSSSSKEPLLIVPPEPFESKRSRASSRALQSRTFPVLPSDAAYGAGLAQSGTGDDPFAAVDHLTDSRGLAHRPRSRSPFTKPGLWEPNPDDPHSRDPANKWWYKPESVGADWLNGQVQWGGHWAVPAVGVGGTNGQSALHFPSIGTFLGIPDDYD
ncbi:hypothetical protein PENTCL1PPCAC_15741 [Pristionchus entomophagus]|uniref:Transmembrane protein n=1 Tax=Pristionchus entomophagus TaxID=358040 RepID=A0AAV5TDC1_9BILA|nr:hypothetical protein PENTCL1PPCAC_15741 [Pristionchus entomophagus]